MRIHKLLTITMFLMLLGLSGNAFAAPPGPDEDSMMAPPGSPPGPMMAAAPGTGSVDPAKQEELRKRMETVRMWKLKDELKLDEKTANQVSAILSKYDEKRMTLRQDERKAFQELRETLKQAKPDENRLKQILARMEKNREDLHQLMTEESGELKGVLTVEQQARYVLFIPKFHHDLKKMMEEKGEHRNTSETKPKSGEAY